MKYEKAQDILPKEIIKVIQEYMDGGYLYIPRKAEHKKSWGEDSGITTELEFRNNEIFNKYIKGTCVKELAESYFLSEQSIRRIIRLLKRKGS